MTRNTPSDRFQTAKAKDPGEAKFLLNRVFTRAERVLRRLPPGGSTEATRYAAAGCHYSDREAALKEAAVERMMVASEAREVLGHRLQYGALQPVGGAARRARRGNRPRSRRSRGVRRSAARQNADILPLVIDIARPPGASGWGNQEHPSFLERAGERFDCVLMLALAHHLIVNERAPLETIFELLARLTSRTAIVEYVDPADAQFQRILRGRDDLHRDLTHARFETAAQRYFRVVGCCDATPTRRIYALEKAVR